MSSARRPEPVCGFRHYQDGYNRTHRGGMALAADHARVPGDRDLLATTFDLAAKPVDEVAGIRD